jgi:hypothetical protein
MPADPTPETVDAEHEAQIREWLLMPGVREKGESAGDSCGACHFLLRLLDTERAEVADWRQRFDRFWEAQMRGVEAWRAAHPGNELVLPDMAQMTEWLVGEIARLTKDCETLKVRIKAETAKLDVYEPLAPWKTKDRRIGQGRRQGIVPRDDGTERRGGKDRRVAAQPGASRRIAILTENFSDKTYRDGYVASHTRGVLAQQMRNFRGNRSQEEFAANLDTQKTIIGRLENPAYSGWSLRTLLEIARKMNVAVFCRFVDLPTFLHLTEDLSDKALNPAFDVPAETAPPGTSAMERVYKAYRDAAEDEVARGSLPDTLAYYARLVEQAEREARAGYVEESRRLREEAVAANRREAHAAGVIEGTERERQRCAWWARAHATHPDISATVIAIESGGPKR